MARFIAVRDGSVVGSGNDESRLRAAIQRSEQKDLDRGRIGYLGIEERLPDGSRVVRVVLHGTPPDDRVVHPSAAPAGPAQPALGGSAAAPAWADAPPEWEQMLRRLAQLRDEGILTEEEFAAKKRQVLDSL